MDHGGFHNHEEDEAAEGEDEEGEEECEGECEEEEPETEEAFNARSLKAKVLYKDDVEIKYKNKSKSPFKHLFRSKGFLWLSNHPSAFF